MTQALPYDLNVPARRTLVVGQSFGAVALLLELVLIVGVSVAAGIAYHLYILGNAGNLADYVTVGVAVALFYILPQWYQGRYDISEMTSDRFHLQNVLYGWNFAFFSVLLIAFLAKQTGVYSRGAVILFYAFGVIGLTGLRHGLAYLVRQGFRSGWLAARRVMLLGTMDKIVHFHARYRPVMHGLHVVGEEMLPGSESGDVATPNEDDFAMHLKRAVAKARSLNVQDIFLLLPWFDAKTINSCSEAFLVTPASVHLGPERVLDRFSDVRILKLGPATSITLTRPPLTPFEILTKRVLDVAAAGLGLVLLSPILLLVAALIKLDSPGPVLFRQRRHGFNQQLFRILKFRTMTTTDDGAVIRQATNDDPRVTRVGRFLRRWSIDELPQLINVLRGEMSIVGPRPHALAHDHDFERRIASYARRHNVKPGITGWAQVNGHRGPTDTNEKIRARVEHDLYYIDNWSIWFDLHIIATTILSQKAHRNAH